LVGQWERERGEWENEREEWERERGVMEKEREGWERERGVMEKEREGWERERGELKEEREGWGKERREKEGVERELRVELSEVISPLSENLEDVDPYMEAVWVTCCLHTPSSGWSKL
jgi:chromosome segregation ATPase